MVVAVNNTHSDDMNHDADRWSDKVIQDYGRNKLVEFSHPTVGNMTYISGEMLWEKKVQKATNSSQHGSLNW
jgi:hypothetical protein